MTQRIQITLCIPLLILIVSPRHGRPQIPLERVLSRVAVPSEEDLRGLVDTKGFPTRADQMDFIGKRCEQLERQAILDNQKRLGLTEQTALIAGICPHDDYMTAGRVYAHVQRYVKASTVILIGNAHWSEAFGIRGRLIFGDFRNWRGPYGPVNISTLRERIISGLKPESFTVHRKLVETEHSLEGILPYLQYYNRRVQIVPILVPLTDWETMERLTSELAAVVAQACREIGWKLGEDLAVLCSTDGQHYGDYGWSYYDYHPYGCDADAYSKAMGHDREMIGKHFEGAVLPEKIHALFSTLVDQEDIGKYRVTWCGRFAAPLGVEFAGRLARAAEQRTLSGFLLRTGSSLSDPWLPLESLGMGVTSDTNLHHFVTYFAVGFK